MVAICTYLLPVTRVNCKTIVTVCRCGKNTKGGVCVTAARGTAPRDAGPSGQLVRPAGVCCDLHGGDRDGEEMVLWAQPGSNQVSRGLFPHVPLGSEYCGRESPPLAYGNRK